MPAHPLWDVAHRLTAWALTLALLAALIVMIGGGIDIGPIVGALMIFTFIAWGGVPENPTLRQALDEWRTARARRL